MADSTSSSSFFFADHLILDESPTRDFYRSLLQGLIHKNNNMLGVIQGFSSLILMDEDIATGIRENVTQMKDSSQEASDIAKVILTASGCARVTAEKINLQEFLPHIEQTIRFHCEEHGVPITFNAAAALPEVMADTNRFSELLKELFKNAAEAAASISGGEVAVDVLPPGEASPPEKRQVDFFIRNSSEAIDPESLPGLFEPFHSTRGAEHWGIGLTMAGVLAGQMKMRLGIRSAEGTTTVWLGIPAAD